MPALITHRLFGEKSIDRLPAGLITSDEERTAFLIANQGPDPFFFRARTLNLRACMALGQRMHAERISRQFSALRDGVGHLCKADASLGRAFALGLLSHYVLDRNAHPFVYDQQWGIQRMDEDLASAGSKVHALIEGDLDVLMLQRERAGATVAQFPPAEVLRTTERVDRVAGALMSFTARRVYDLSIGAVEYGGAVADMRLVYRLIEPAGSPVSRVVGALEGLVSDYSLVASLAHRVTGQEPSAVGNMAHIGWENPFTGAKSHESFPEVFDRALDDYEHAAALFATSEDMVAVTGHMSYSGRVLKADEECDGDE